MSVGKTKVLNNRTKLMVGVLTLFFAVATSKASTIAPTNTIKPDNLSTQLLDSLIIAEINQYRIKNRLDTIELSPFLSAVAKELAEFMIAEDNYSATAKKRKKTPSKASEKIGEILLNKGGSGQGAVIDAKRSLRNVSELTYKDLAKDIVLNWLIRPTNEQILYEPTNVLYGIKSSVNPSKRQLQVYLVLGNYLSENQGGELARQSQIQYQSKNSKLKPHDTKVCRSVERKRKEWPKLYSGITIDDGHLVFNNPNTRQVQSFFRSKTSGLALDFIFPEQYLSSENILIDYSLPNRGITTKPISGKTLLKRNQFRKEKTTQFKATIGTLPTLPGKKYEYNLLLLEDGHVCASVAPGFSMSFLGNYHKELRLLADTVSIANTFEYKPKPDSILLSFRIPFEKRKYTYKAEDIEPFLRLLNEPDFVIYEIEISAFTSIEGSDEENMMLQRKRAESIVDALKARQKDEIISKIITEPCWEDFKRDVMSTKNNILASMTLSEAQEYIRRYNLSKELEPILKNHRYAQIDIRVTYDISGPKEQDFVLRQFHKAIAEKKLPLALAIQKYIMKSVMSGKYPMRMIMDQKIPMDRLFAGLLMNNLYMVILADGMNVEKYMPVIEDLYRLNPSNEYIQYNYLLCQVLYKPLPKDISTIQNQIQGLYYKTFTKETVDALNMQYQFKLLAAADSMPNSERLKRETIDRIKEIIDVRYETPENAIKLANLFLNAEEYTIALDVLENFIDAPDVNENLLFTWLSLCSYVPEKQLTRKFARVIETVYRKNPEQTCKLFDGKHFSYRVFENPEVKKLYLKHCLPAPVSSNP